MSDQRARVLDAAIDVLAEGGSRALTHRAVDARAGVPLGTTSNHFRSRAQLVGGVADELERRDAALVADLAQGSVSRESIPGLVAELARRQVADPAPHRARFALALEPGVDLSAQHDRLLALATGLLADARVPDPALRARMLTDLIDGAVLHAVTLPGRGIDPEQIAGAAELLLRDARE